MKQISYFAVQEKCTKLNNCERALIINLDEHEIILKGDLTVIFDGYNFTVDQTKQIDTDQNAFKIARLGDKVLFISPKMGFWVIWDSQQTVKIGVSAQLHKQVDGLCGYFSSKKNDDKRMPDGTVTNSTKQFIGSWRQTENNIECKAKLCPAEIQHEAWEICNTLK